MRPQVAKTVLLGMLLALSVHAARAETAAELISRFRGEHGEPRVTSDATLNRIALEQARAMAARDQLGHDVAGSFSSRIVASRAGRAAENVAFGYDSFEKTLQQWIASSEHRKNLLLHNASRIGVASAKDPTGRRTYWAMEIAGDYEKPAKRIKEPLVAVVKREPAAVRRHDAAGCHIKIMSLCL